MMAKNFRKTMFTIGDECTFHGIINGQRCQVFGVISNVTAECLWVCLAEPASRGRGEARVPDYEQAIPFRVKDLTSVNPHRTVHQGTANNIYVDRHRDEEDY